jgi:hypothetical protein
MKRSLFKLAASLALGSFVPVQAAVPASEASRCIEPREMEGLVAYFLPEVINEVSKNCSAHLPSDSYARTRLPHLAEQLTTAKAASWPVAKAAFLKMAKPEDAKTMGELPDEALRPMVDAVMVRQISIPVTAPVCGDVNDISEALAPLTAEQTVHLLSAILVAASRKDDKLRSCPRESR